MESVIGCCKQTWSRTRQSTADARSRYTCCCARFMRRLEYFYSTRKYLIFSYIYCVMAKKLLGLAKSTLVCSRNCKFLHVNKYIQRPYYLGIWLQNHNIVKFFSIVFPTFIWHSVGRVILFYCLISSKYLFFFCHTTVISSIFFQYTRW